MRGSGAGTRWWPLLLGIALAGCVRKPGVPLEMLTWDRDFPAHQVAGNIYFVGRKNVGIFLITSPQGHILLDSGFEASVPAVQASVERLGFRFQDIKYLLASHAHIDHVQGHARVRALTGARVLASEQDAPFIRSGGQDDPNFGNRYRWAPCPIDQVVRDGDTVTLGDIVMTAHLTPGHTPGATTWTTRVREGGRDLRVVFFPSGNVLPGTRLVGNTAYPTIAGDFARSFAVWKALPCDVFLAAHGAFYGLDAKYPRLAQGGENPFIDPAGFRQTIADLEARFRAVLESQQ
jgi:metallo-beta-lactamase class B